MHCAALVVIGIACKTATAGSFQTGDLWYTLEGATGTGSYNVIESGPRHALIIEKSGDVTFRIGMNFTSYSGAFAGWHVGIEAATTSGSAVFNNGLLVGTGYDQSFSGGPDGTSAFAIERGSMAGVGSVGLLYTFDLSITGDALGNTASVTGDFGTNGAWQSSGIWWYGYAGANTGPRYGVPEAWYSPRSGFGPLPVIIVRTVPEPLTLGLLGWGVLALLKRKRRQDRSHQALSR